MMTCASWRGSEAQYIYIYIYICIWGSIRLYLHRTPGLAGTYRMSLWYRTFGFARRLGLQLATFVDRFADD